MHKRYEGFSRILANIVFKPEVAALLVLQAVRKHDSWLSSFLGPPLESKTGQASQVSTQEGVWLEPC